MACLACSSSFFLKAAGIDFTLKAYLVHGSEHLSRVGDSLHGAGEDVQGQFQPLQNSAAFAVHAQAPQGLKTHPCTHPHTHFSQSSHWASSSGGVKAAPPPASLCLCSAPAGCSPQPGSGHVPPPEVSASGCTGHNGRPWRFERRPPASKTVNISLILTG